jgi:hypothetical protein
MCRNIIGSAEAGLQIDRSWTPISKGGAVKIIEVNEKDLLAFLPEIFVASGATRLSNFMKV